MNRFARLAVLAVVVLGILGQPAVAGKGKLKVFLLAGQSNMEGQAVVDLDHQDHYNGGKGNLEHVMKDPAKAARYKHLRGADGKWTVRDDVWVWYRAGDRGDMKVGKL